MSFGLGFSVLEDVGARGLARDARRVRMGRRLPFDVLGGPGERLLVVHLTQVIPAGDLDDYEIVRAMVYAALTDGQSAPQARAR